MNLWLIAAVLISMNGLSQVKNTQVDLIKTRVGHATFLISRNLEFMFYCISDLQNLTKNVTERHY